MSATSLKQLPKQMPSRDEIDRAIETIETRLGRGERVVAEFIASGDTESQAEAEDQFIALLDEYTHLCDQRRYLYPDKRVV